ncbi:MAG: hypothetical protein MJ142_02230 [Clostridia bacterium]|nr:hypothetical protein [Clostridia bacterium]
MKSKREKDLEAREKAVKAREEAVAMREEAIRKESFLTTAIREKKEEWFDKVHLTVHQLDIIIYIVIALLVIVVILIILEAAGIFKIGG